MSEPTPQNESTTAKEVASLLAQTELSLSRAGLDSLRAHEVLAAIRQAASSDGELDQVKQTIGEKVQLARQWQKFLQDTLGQVESLEKRWQQRERFGEKWWRQHRAALWANTDSAAGRTTWLRLLAEALLAGEMTICEKLVTEPLPFLNSDSALRIMVKAGAGALREERYPDALDLLAFFSSGEGAEQDRQGARATRRSMGDHGTILRMRSL